MFYTEYNCKSHLTGQFTIGYLKTLLKLYLHTHAYIKLLTFYEG